MSHLQHFRDVYIIAFVAWMKYFNIILLKVVGVDCAIYGPALVLLVY